MTCSRSHRELKGRILTLVVGRLRGSALIRSVGSVTLPTPLQGPGNFLLSVV